MASIGNRIGIFVHDWLIRCFMLQLAKLGQVIQGNVLDDAFVEHFMVQAVPKAIAKFDELLGMVDIFNAEGAATVILNKWPFDYLSPNDKKLLINALALEDNGRLETFGEQLRQSVRLAHIETISLLASLEHRSDCLQQQQNCQRACAQLAEVCRQRPNIPSLYWS